MEVVLASSGDIGELFSLQRAAFVDEAVIYGTPHVPALDEQFDAFESRHAESTTFTCREGTRIVGAVSVRQYEERPDIERLMTVPDRRGHGIASGLMDRAEQFIRSEGHGSVQLIVGELATDNRRLYERLGYETTERWHSPDFPDVVLLRMTKQLSG